MIIRTLLAAAVTCSGFLLATATERGATEPVKRGATEPVERVEPVVPGNPAEPAVARSVSDETSSADSQSDVPPGIPGSDSEGQDAKAAATTRSALEPFNALVGDWRGTGQVRRGSNRGAWREKTSVAWSFVGRPTIVLTADGGLHYETLKITSKDGRLTATQTLHDRVIEYRGPLPAKWPGKVELLSEPDTKGVTYRCTLQQLSDIRATILLEKRSSPTGSFRRVAGVGYTRSGERLAQVGGTSRKCIVTGGLGTIAVSHKGQTYYVCCQGCVQAFNDAPEEIIAEYKASLRQKK